ncbi:ATP-grasp domain-containing protein [Agrobacterium vitis]|uniref:ATP-grasp domain-containing protein n=1 Tax=Agrobacterium vitis TaxID=373 RepID=A0AAE2UXC1_AGRVI|nr:ATP-grasp domain-containing protein [Agrobacterium vitis]MBF2717665.1 ATP-grasp domain-containing protein [Agrobacterium vitis]MVA22605.1 ATP-grasp domain-containing protein [Agrobacterium vitis]
MSEDTVVIVDSYLPTNRGRGSLLESFTQAGAKCVRVQSSPELPIVFRSSLKLDGYVANITHTGDLTDTLDAIAHYSPLAVVPGSEVGVEFADILSERLNLPSNGTTKSPARRDKFRMIETIRAAGLTAAAQIKVDDDDHLREWHSKLGRRVVLKPIRGGNGGGIHFCDTVDQSARAYQELISAGNVYTSQNDAVVAQEYLWGPEYMVNTVSCDGAHHVCDIWQTNRLSTNNVLDLCGSISILPRDRGPADTLVEYAYGVLDALDIRNGPAHLEIKMTPAGPCLIEIGARTAGGDLQHHARLSTGESQLEWTVDAYLRPDRFKRRVNEPYKVLSHFTSVALISPHSGILNRYIGLDEIVRLESVHEIRQLVQPGEQLHRTVDDLTYPVIVTLMHSLEEIVRRDAETIRYLDGSAFYQLKE